MALAMFKDLCMDAGDPATLGAFWAAALGLELSVDEDGDARLTGPTDAHTIWIDRVPEPKTVKNRLHLDVHGSHPSELTALGATILDADSFHWTVMADPEGGEFCFFTRDEVPEYRLYEVNVNCADHEAAARWWAEAIGGNRTSTDRGFTYLEEVENLPFRYLVFAEVPEPKATKNRIHLDLTGDAAALLDAGATLLRAQDDEIRWDVLADPEGNEFCVFPPR